MVKNKKKDKKKEQVAAATQEAQDGAVEEDQAETVVSKPVTATAPVSVVAKQQEQEE